MNTFRASVFATILVTSPSVFADPVSIGISIDKAIADMQAKKYKETALAMEPGDKANELKFWQVDDGVLIASYSKDGRKIINLSYWFADDRAVNKRQVFNFEVSEFNPDTGVMTIQTKKP